MINNLLQVILFFLLGWAAAKIILPGIYKLACKNGCLAFNYCYNKIPLALGIVFFLASLLVFAITVFIIPLTLKQKTVYFLLAMSAFTLLGLVDDFWGSHQSRGFIGHFNSLLKGELTTGAVKAFAGTGMAIIISSLTGDYVLVPLNVLIITLSVNIINLLDLRPGRAGKVFLILSLLFLLAFPGQPELVFIATAAGSLTAYLPVDLKARGMMGDTGSNALGAVLGLSAVWLMDLWLKLFYLAVLVFLHLLAEKYSFSKIIAGNRILNYLDRLGTKT